MQTGLNCMHGEAQVAPRSSAPQDPGGSVAHECAYFPGKTILEKQGFGEPLKLYCFFEKLLFKWSRCIFAENMNACDSINKPVQYAVGRSKNL